jgi:anti-sigma regulatory factor (Ser/Thr protein kinase)
VTTATTYGTGRFTPTFAVPQRSVAVSIAANPAAVPRLRRLVRCVGDHWGLCETVVDVLVLIASELVTNAVVHSGSVEVQLLLTADGNQAAVHVRDHGCWQEAHQNADAIPTGGRGLDMVRAYGELLLAPSQSGTTATARLALNPPTTEAP